MVGYIYCLKFAHRELEQDGWERKLSRTRLFISRETPSIKLMYIHDLGSNYLPPLPLKNISIGPVRISVSVDQPTPTDNVTHQMIKVTPSVSTSI